MIWETLAKKTNDVMGCLRQSFASRSSLVPGVLCPVQGSPVQEGHGHTGESPMKDYKVDYRTGAISYRGGS